VSSAVTGSMCAPASSRRTVLARSACRTSADNRSAVMPAATAAAVVAGRAGSERPIASIALNVLSSSDDPVLAYTVPWFRTP
jgi:hypothetical protein